MARKLTTKAITDDAITADKIVAGAVTADIPSQGITTDKIADLGVTHAKLHNTMDLSSKTVTLPAASVTHANLHSTMDLSSKTVTLPSLATLEVSAGAPTISLNSPGQVTDKKTNRIAVSQYTAGDFSVQQMNDNGTIGGTPLLITRSGNVGIGTTAPDTLLQLQKTRGTISGGSSDTGAVIKLHTVAQWESAYGNNSTTSTNDFLGGIEFSTSDTSTGTGVRAAIRTTVDTYYNTNSLRFYTAPSNTAGLLNRLNIASNGNIGIGNESMALSPGSQIVISKNYTTYNNGDNNKRIDFQANGTSSRSETIKTFHYSYNPEYNRYTWHSIKLGDASSASGHSIRYRVIWTTGHASGHAYEEGVCSVVSHHSTRNLNRGATGGQGEAHVRYAYQYNGGSYYGWSSTPNVRFYYSSANDANAQIYMRVEGHGNHNGSTWDMACTHTIFVELHGNDNVTNRTVRFTGHSTPSDTNSAISFITLNT
tara:strand:+ start:440 stop:1882 length:1443 start_codon:yes stop_codon:yes gene_type:complete